MKHFKKGPQKHDFFFDHHRFLPDFPPFNRCTAATDAEKGRRAENKAMFKDKYEY